MRKGYFLELEKEGHICVRGCDSCPYDPDWIGTPTKTWIIRRES
ncbi:MAG: hypothetical protein NWF14_02430 [Candidatus Bathyarchaeota archaeon]|nr:hypothetical protein [Candidatus Bathyarchaeota archaeon]